MYSFSQKMYGEDIGQWMSPSECARKLLQELNMIKIPIQPRKIARQLGIWVWEREIEGGYDGYLMRVGNTFGIMINSAIKSEARKNFTIAHELGHYEFDRHKKFQRAWLIKESESFCENKQEELQANQFAVELLMPKERFITDMNKQAEVGLFAIDALAHKYCTSLTSTAIRYARFSPHTCAVVISKGGRIRYFAYSKAFSADENCYLVKDMPLHAGSYARQLFDNNLTDEEASGEVPISYWCKSNSDGILFEQSRSLSRFRQVLSFIWLNRDTRDEGSGIQLMLF
ncbi:MAG: ImmA/IrrE family metallo-endopeptidase [Candidatus Poribacteria bacterium]